MLNLDYSFLNWAVIQSFVAKGFWFSIQLTLVSMIGGIVLGTLLAMMRLSSHKWLSVPAALAGPTPPRVAVSSPSATIERRSRRTVDSDVSRASASSRNDT